MKAVSREAQSGSASFGLPRTLSGSVSLVSSEVGEAEGGSAILVVHRLALSGLWFDCERRM
jgi:hypothetical protein